MIANEMLIIMGALVFFNIFGILYSKGIIVLYASIISLLHETRKVFIEHNKNTQDKIIKDEFIPMIIVITGQLRVIVRFFFATLVVNSVFFMYMDSMVAGPLWSVVSIFVAFTNTSCALMLFNSHNIKNKIYMLVVSYREIAISLTLKK